MTRRFPAALAACALALPAAPAAAQPRPTGAPAQLPWLQTVSVNPIGLPLGIFSAEYEVALAAPGVTAALGGTVTSNSFAYTREDRWASARLMYYPGEVAFRGLAVGVSLGAHRARRKDDDPPAMRARDSGLTLGILGSYNHLLGRQQRLVVGAGLGFRRVLKNTGGTSPLSQAYPDGRMLLGFAF